MKKIIFIPALLFAVQLMAQKTYLFCGKLIDGIGNTSFSNKTIIIEKYCLEFVS